MCFALAPLAAAGISAGVGAAQAGLSYIGQNQAASAQEDYQRALHEQNSEIATQNFFNQSRLLNTRRIQERQRAFQEISQVQSDSVRSQSLLAVSAGEAGVSGASVNDLMRDFQQQEADFITDVRLNERFAEAQLSEDQLSIQSNTRSRIAQTIPRPVTRPNFGNLLIGVAGAGLNAFNQFSVTDPVSGFRTLTPTSNLRIPIN